MWRAGQSSLASLSPGLLIRGLLVFVGGFLCSESSEPHLVPHHGVSLEYMSGYWEDKVKGKGCVLQYT